MANELYRVVELMAKRKPRLRRKFRVVWMNMIWDASPTSLSGRNHVMTAYELSTDMSQTWQES